MKETDLHDLDPVGEIPLEPACVSENAALSLKANFGWTFVGNAIYMGCQWGILIVLAKVGNPVMVGKFALGLAVTAPVMMLTNLQLRGVQATDARNEYRFGDYLELRIVSTGIALALIAGIVFLGQYRGETALVILSVGLAKSFESISDVFYGLFQQKERMDRIAKSMILKGAISLAALGVGVYLTGTVLWGTLCLASIWLLVLIAYDVPNGKNFLHNPGYESGNSRPVSRDGADGVRLSWNKEILAKLAWVALPMGFVMMMNSLATNVPRYLIESYLGERELGIFAAMAYLMLVGNTVIGALGQSATPKLARYYAVGDIPGFRRLLVNMLSVGAVLGGVGVLVSWMAGREILTIIYRAEYAERSDVLVLLMIATAISYGSGFLGTAVTAMRSFRVQVPIHCTNLVIILCGSVLLVRTNGLSGAAWAILISAFFSTSVYGAVAVYKMKARVKEIS